MPYGFWSQWWQAREQQIIVVETALVPPSVLDGKVWVYDSDMNLYWTQRQEKFYGMLKFSRNIQA